MDEYEAVAMDSSLAAWRVASLAVMLVLSTADLKGDLTVVRMGNSWVVNSVAWTVDRMAAPSVEWKDDKKVAKMGVTEVVLWGAS